ncbi:hypothetical protein GCM10023080_022380 [Streptomyces pseudoechinosporeus]
MKQIHPGSLRRLALAVGAMLALLLASLMAPTSAAAGGGDGGAADKHGKTLQVVLVHQEPVFGDPASMDPGDVQLFEDPAVVKGKSAGDSLTQIQFLEGGSFLLDCTVRLEDKGNLVFAGGEEAANLETKTTFAVAGGTGTFSGTGGHVDITPTKFEGKDASLLTFHLEH